MGASLQCRFFLSGRLISYRSKYFQLIKLNVVTKVENNIFKITIIANKSQIEYLNDYFVSYRTNLRKTRDMIKGLTSQTLVIRPLGALYGIMLSI